ncbi:hypothetical protein GEMRC1_009743 [Eukaryota sp. GEM-RC1]
MIQKNTTLLVLYLEGVKLKPIQFKTILGGLKLNSTLKSVSFTSLDLCCLLSIFEGITSNKLITNFQVSDSSIDFVKGVVRCGNQISNFDLVSLLDALKSNLPIKRVNCLGVTSPSLEGLIAFFEILSLNKSVLELDVSPHIIDIENGVFLFSPTSSTKIDGENMSFLKSVLKRVDVKS